MSEQHEKEPVPAAGDGQAAQRRMPGPLQPGGAAEHYGSYVLALLIGCLVAISIHYLLRGANLQLSPETFVSLVFTIAVGAASLVLAVVAITYGRVSERVMTERADRSIDIQMSLFQKSLDLQTQLFDKTMSTLESIGRSTGVTEQRLGDIHSLMQNPAFVKQIAGRAVEQATSDLTSSDKVGAGKGESDAHLAERLTKNIVDELSSRWERLTMPNAPLAAAYPSNAISIGAGLPSGRPAPAPKTFEERAAEYRAKLRYQAVKKQIRSVLDRATSQIPGVSLESTEGPLAGGLWDLTLNYKGRLLAVDFRTGPGPETGQTSSYDRSIEKLFENPGVDCLLFLFFQPPTKNVREAIESKAAKLEGRVRILAATDEAQLQNDLLALLESVVAALPSGG